MNVKTAPIGRVVVLLAGLILATTPDARPGAASSLLAQTTSTPASSDADRLKSDAGRALQNFLRTDPTPSQCKIGIQLGPKRYVVALSKMAGDAGLRRGDFPKTVAGLSLADPQQRSRVNAALSSAVPAEVVVERKGQSLTVSVPCESEPGAWAAMKRAWEAAATGDWDTCQAAALDVVRARGLVTSFPLQLRARCANAQWSSQRSQEVALRSAKAMFEWEQARIRENAYEPGGLDDIRGSVLNNVTVLRRGGFNDFANAIEEQLRTALSE